MSAALLTPEQLANWRRMAPVVFGVSVAGLTDDEVNKLRDHLQARIDKESETCPPDTTTD